MNTKLNRSDYAILCIYFGVSVFLQIIDYQEQKNILKEYIFDIPAGVICPLISIFIFMHWLIPNFIVNQKKYIQFAVLGLLTMIVFGIVEYVIGFWSGENDIKKFPNFLQLLRKGIGVSAEDVSLSLGLLLGKKYYEGQLEYSDIKRRQKDNELKLLRSQIDPHFLFNNLNTLDALIDSAPSKAKEYINRLSLIYRYLIKTKEAEVMELSEEIDFAENYIFLIQIRFEKDYHFVIDKQASLHDKYIPTGALQTLLENIIKHNKGQHPLVIQSEITIEEAQLVVVNSKAHKKVGEESLGTGLDNLQKRYALLTDRKIHIDDTENEFRIAIPILRPSLD